MAGPDYSLGDHDYDLNDVRSGATGALGAYGVYSNLQKNTTAGDVRAATGTTSLLGKTGIFGDNTADIEGGASMANNALGIYQGLEKGGVVGDLSAAANAGQLYAGASSAIVRGGGAALGGASSIGEVAGPLAAGLAVYNFAENWQSGDTAGDTIRGAEAGAAVGSVIPVVGTVVGAVIGAAVGAISSMFGPGKQDPETANWDKYAQVYAQKGASGVSGANPSQNFQLLAGIFDSRGGAGANSIPFYAKYGRMGEAAFTADMTTQINTALAKGTIAPNAPPDQIYQKVVLPWINQMQPGKTLAQAGKTVDGVPTVGPIQNILTTMIAQYQNGSLNSTAKLGIAGQTIPQMQKFGAMGTPPNTQKIQATVQDHTAQFNTSVSAFPMAKTAAAGGGGAAPAGASPAAASTSASGALATMALMMPSLLSGGSKQMAAPTNNTGTGTGGASVAPQADVGNPVGGDSSSGSGDSSSILGDVGSFLGANIGGIGEAAVVGGIGMSQANAQKKENDQLAGSLSAAGKPATDTGNAILTQIQGGAQAGGALGKSISQQTAAASELGDIATEYATGKTTPAQDQQLNDYAKQQKAMVDSQLAASGNLDSSARQAAYQQIDNNVATMKQNLIAGNTQMASAALASVQQTYSTLLNQSLSESEFGFSTQEAAVQLQIQSDTMLSQSLNQLFAGIAQGFGNTAKSGGSSTGAAVGKAVGGALSSVGKAVAGGASGGKGGSGVASSAAGGGFDTTDPNSDAMTNLDMQKSGDFSSQGDIDSFFDSSSNDISNYDFSDETGSDPFGDGSWG